MSIWSKDEAAPGDVRRFWLAPLCAAGTSLRAQRAAGSQHLAWLLDTDTALRRAFAAANAAAAATAAAGTGTADASSTSTGGSSDTAARAVLPPAPGAAEGAADVVVPASAVPATSARVMGALHFAALFWPFDAQQPRLRRAYDAWHAAVRQTPLPADERWAVASEVCPFSFFSHL